MDPLQPGDCIGVFSPSSPTNAKAVERLTTYFESRGFRVRVSPHTLLDDGYMAGPAAKRAEDFNSLVADSDVACVMTANGGASAIQTVPLLDYELLRRNPKLICGLSDPTSVLNAISAKAGICTFHGPNGYNFGHRTPTGFTEANWWRIVTGDHEIPYTFPVSSEMRVLRGADGGGPDVVEGRIYGGNLRSLTYLVGSQYMPRLDNCVVFIEEIDMQPHDMDALLNHLTISSAITKAAALVIGQLVDCVETDYEMSGSWEDMVLRTFGDCRFPIVANVPLGHTDDKITIPIGCRVRLDLSAPSLQLVESPFG